ncbi:aspartate/glutamate racemase family protein [Variovorax sp. HJSM1_2]|uniref:aspartate/glutamate racemase family protein n=1 Tax=Variovorax sp. HJSM1_2 TaxID=3366263 RepID=UPI003BDA5904
MPKILLLNPNTNAATTQMMADIAQSCLPPGFTVTGISAQAGVSMIINEAEMRAAALEVERSWLHAGMAWDGVIISAFGDPGIEQVRATAKVPVVGICEASLLDGAANGRRFGVATVTPALADLIQTHIVRLNLGPHYTGIRLTDEEPRALAADPAKLLQALTRAAQRCLEDDGADAVVIGGGPLGQAAMQIQTQLQAPIIAPIPSAVRRLLAACTPR